MDRLTLVELIEAEKAKLTSEARELWEELDTLLYMEPEDETTQCPQEREVVDRMADLAAHDQHIINRLTELRAGLYSSDHAERRGESAVGHRERAVIIAAGFKDRDEGRMIDPYMTPEQAVARLREGA